MEYWAQTSTIILHKLAFNFWLGYFTTRIGPMSHIFFATWIGFLGPGLQLRSPSKGVLSEAHNQLAPTKYSTTYKHFPS